MFEYYVGGLRRLNDLKALQKGDAIEPKKNLQYVVFEGVLAGRVGGDESDHQQNTQFKSWQFESIRFVSIHFISIQIDLIAIQRTG